MKYEKTNDANFLGKWRFHAQFTYYFDWVGRGANRREKWKNPQDEEAISFLEFFLRGRARGSWERVGNNFYFMDLEDAFNMRMLFSENLKFLREAGSFPRPQLPCGKS